jgi:hypothetical protein
MASLPPSEAIEFAGFVLLHCAAIADGNRGGELICPFAVLADERGRRVVDFESETQEGAVAKGWASLSDSRSRLEWWAFGREGMYRTVGEATDVLLVSVWTPQMTEPASVMQRFVRGPEQELYLVGSPELLVHGPEGAEPAEEWDHESLHRGLSSHPKGERWSTWRSQ